MTERIQAIDTVVNIWTKEALASRPDRSAFFRGKIGVDRETFEGVSLEQMIERMDEAGTPWCVTVDFQTLEDGTVTLRDRDSMKQERLTIPALVEKMDAEIG